MLRKYPDPRIFKYGDGELHFDYENKLAPGADPSEQMTASEMEKPRRIFRIVALLCWFGACALPAPRTMADNTAVPPSYEAHGLLKINMDYYELSASSGGDFYFWAPGEFAMSRLQIPIEHEPIFLANGVFEGRSRSFAFPVDSVTERLTVFAGAQRKEVFQLTRPSGSAVMPGDPDVRVQEFRHMLLVTVTEPQPGTWQANLQGAGRFSFSARTGTEPLAVIDFDFVELRGRPGHEGYFPIREGVHAGEARVCRVVFSGPYETAEFAFVSGEGDPLAVLDLAAGTPHGASDEYLGACVVPTRPFRLQVKGRDAWGVAYQRMYSPLYTPKGGR